MRRVFTTIASLVLSYSAADAGFESWSVSVETDPFSKGQRVTVDYMSSIRSGVLIFCDTAEKGFVFRAVPGFAYESTMDGFKPELEFAIDGERLLGQPGQVGAVGDNIASAETRLEGDNAMKFVEAFAKAKSQIAVKDGISDRPHLMKARGSTKAGAALVGCMRTQTGG